MKPGPFAAGFALAAVLSGSAVARCPPVTAWSVTSPGEDYASNPGLRAVAVPDGVLAVARTSGTAGVWSLRHYDLAGTLLSETSFRPPVDPPSRIDALALTPGGVVLAMNPDVEVGPDLGAHASSPPSDLKFELVMAGAGAGALVEVLEGAGLAWSLSLTGKPEEVGRVAGVSLDANGRGLLVGVLRGTDYNDVPRIVAGRFAVATGKLSWTRTLAAGMDVRVLAAVDAPRGGLRVLARTTPSFRWLEGAELAAYRADLTEQAQGGDPKAARRARRLLAHAGAERRMLVVSREPAHHLIGLDAEGGIRWDQPLDEAGAVMETAQLSTAPDGSLLVRADGHRRGEGLASDDASLLAAFAPDGATLWRSDTVPGVSRVVRDPRTGHWFGASDRDGLIEIEPGGLAIAEHAPSEAYGPDPVVVMGSAGEPVAVVVDGNANGPGRRSLRITGYRLPAGCLRAAFEEAHPLEVAVGGGVRLAVEVENAGEVNLAEVGATATLETGILDAHKKSAPPGAEAGNVLYVEDDPDPAHPIARIGGGERRRIRAPLAPGKRVRFSWTVEGVEAGDAGVTVALEARADNGEPLMHRDLSERLRVNASSATPTR